MSINIYNPNEFPYGVLSNNYVHPHPLIIDEKRWNTVTNYIYSNLLITPINRLKLQVAPIIGSNKKTKIEAKIKQSITNIELKQRRKLTPEEIKDLTDRLKLEVELDHMDIYTLFNHLLGTEKIQLMRTSIEKAYNSKVVQHPNISQALLSTENRPIVYKSDNGILGIGKEGNGLNLIGKILMQIRHNIRVQSKFQEEDKKKSENEDAILTAYRAFNILESKANEGDTLENYIGQTAQNIVDYSKDEKISWYIKYNKEDILKNYYRDLSLPDTNLSSKIAHIISVEIKQPGYIVPAVRKLMIRSIKEKLEKKRESIIFNTYVEALIHKKYKNMSPMDVKKAISQMTKDVEDMSAEKLLQTTKRVLDLYYKDALPEKVTALITKNLREINVPDDDDVEQAEMQIKEQLSDSEDDDSNSSSDSESESESTEDEEDRKYGLKKILGSDSKARKHFLIQEIQKYTGKSYETYKDKPVEELEEILKKRTAKKGGVYKEGVGYWEILSSDGILIKKIKGSRPSRKEIAKYIRKYNNKNSTSIPRNEVTIKWVSTLEDSSQEEAKEEVKEDIINEYNYEKDIGQEIFIYPVPKQTEKALRELSPTFMHPFTVDDFGYPSVSYYLTTMLLTHTGIKFDIKNVSSVSRGMSVREARELISTPIENVDTSNKPENTTIMTVEYKDINEANEIYNNKYKETMETLLKTFCTIAMKKKFEDRHIQHILLLTGKKEIIYNDPNDSILGVPNNFVGKLMGNIKKSLQIFVNASNFEKAKEKYRDLVSRTEDSVLFYDGQSFIDLKGGDINMANITYKDYNRKLLKAPILPERLADFVLNDPFVSSWVENKVQDMCGTVYKMKQFLTINNVDEDITPKMMNIVLNTIYQPNPELVQRTSTLLTEEQYDSQVFSDQAQKEKIIKKIGEFIKECGGLPEYSRQYDSKVVGGIVEVGEIDRLENEMQELREQFWGIKAPSKVSEPIDKSMKKLRIMLKKEYESFNKKERTEGERQRFLAKQEHKLKDYISKVFQTEEKLHRSDEEDLMRNVMKEKLAITIDFRQRQEWTGFIYKLLFRKISEEKIAAYIKSFRKRQLTDLQALSDKVNKYMKDGVPSKLEEAKQEYDDYLNRMSDDLEDYITIINTPARTDKDKDQEIKQFIKKLNAEYCDQMGINNSVKSKEEVAEFEANMKRIADEKLELIGNQKKEKLHRSCIIEDMAKFYWFRIYQILRLIAEKKFESKDSVTQQDLRKLIAKSLETSEEPCSPIHINYNEDLKNCIALAMVNIISGIQGFKYEFAEDVETGRLEIDIAKSLILNLDIKETKENKAIQDEDQSIENQIELEDEALEENDFDEYDMANEEDLEAREIDYVDSEVGAEFGMKYKHKAKSSLNEQVKMTLREICKPELSGTKLEECATYFIDQVDEIYNYKMPEKIKLERINFFAKGTNS